VVDEMKNIKAEKLSMWWGDPKKGKEAADAEFGWLRNKDKKPAANVDQNMSEILNWLNNGPDLAKQIQREPAGLEEEPDVLDSVLDWLLGGQDKAPPEIEDPSVAGPPQNGCTHVQYDDGGRKTCQGNGTCLGLATGQ
jgi:hypothetical protein